MTEHVADDVTNEPTGAVKTSGEPTTYYADDIDNQPAGTVQSASEPVTVKADWVPEAKVVDAPEKAAVKKQTRAQKK